VQQQIPFRNDRKKGKCNSRFPSGMTERKASAKASAAATFLWKGRVIDALLAVVIVCGGAALGSGFFFLEGAV